MTERARTFDLERHLIGDSRPMQELRSLVELIAPTALTVLVCGPTGVGKELVVQALHALSGRDGRLVPVNIAAIPDAMFEAEFFGHVRGAFTGAIGNRAGLLIEAHRGTLFLDELSSFSMSTQPKLLRVLETRLFRPVGAKADHRSEFRTLAATNEDMDGMINGGRFRRDLRRRLSEFVIRVPPLSDRRSDIPLLAQHFARQAGTNQTVVSPDALRALDAYDWPDNVRELRQVVMSALALSGPRELTPSAVIASLGDRTGRRVAIVPSDLALDRRRLVKVLDECQWDTARAADRLGVNRSTVYRRMVRYGVSGSDRMGAFDTSENGV